MTDDDTQVYLVTRGRRSKIFAIASTMKVAKLMVEFHLDVPKLKWKDYATPEGWVFSAEEIKWWRPGGKFSIIVVNVQSEKRFLGEHWGNLYERRGSV